MATLHVRNVPADVYEALRRRAEDEGRSISAATIEILRRALPVVPQDAKAFMAQVREFKRRNPWPADGPTPAELIRRDRDSR
jgi:plasmid stability protein